MAIRHEGQVYKVISAEYHPGQGKMGGVTHAHLQNIDTGTFWDHGFRSDLKLDDVPLDRTPMDFLYRDGELCVFMNPETFEQVEIPAAKLGPQATVLTENMRVTVQFADNKPVDIMLPDFLEIRITDTAPPVHNQQDSTWKEAKTDNGLLIMVPQFIKTGDLIRFDVQKMQYMDRAKGPAK
jgi:elongation factor P